MILPVSFQEMCCNQQIRGFSAGQKVGSSFFGHVVFTKCHFFPLAVGDGLNSTHGKSLGMVMNLDLPSGHLLHSYWKWQFIVSFPIKNGDFP